jgi:HptB-dependent secretion and biofilm anti anti-sigma factor
MNEKTGKAFASGINIKELIDVLNKKPDHKDGKLKALSELIKKNEKVEKRSSDRIKEMSADWFLVSKLDGKVRIKIKDNCSEFNVYCYEPLKEIFKSNPIKTKYEVDFSQVSYISSSSLGMLINFYEINGSQNFDIELINCNETIRKILSISKFDKFFRVS